MAYNANIPQPSNQLSQSQADILANFQEIKTLIDVNHEDFASADQGKHKWVTLTQQGAIPPAGSAFGATELGLYNAVNSVTTKNELYVKKVNQVTTVQIPATASILSTSSSPIAFSNGWSYLPSGILLKWGVFTTGVAGFQNFNFPVSATIPVFTGVISAQLSIYSAGMAIDPNQSVNLVALNTTNMSVFGSQRTTTTPSIVSFNYLVIGY